MSPISSDGAPLPLAMVIEYLESSMSTELLGKFPDNSAFDFNYAQSSIWSPLLPRPPRDSVSGDLDLSRKLSFGDEYQHMPEDEEEKEEVLRLFSGPIFFPSVVFLFPESKVRNLIKQTRC
ncbi:UNVERIFIED_CONTAM: hypothetical protein Sangu_2423400 [Sesamum angustifolium]|uniref:Uncharacterized protein n=1 Tax=Sesamum angustifolium TaxID=2727405 RepID=A0AAW2KYX5_9LAMI